jgi:hypothetical protein
MAGETAHDPFDGFFEAGVIPANRLPDMLRTHASPALVRRRGARDRCGQYTFQQPLAGRAGSHVRVGVREYLMLSSYDYLGLIGHPAIECAVVEAVHAHGPAPVRAPPDRHQ